MSRLYKGGRPPKRKSERLNICLSDTEYLQCQKAAEILETSMADVVRKGIASVVRHLKSKGQWDNVPPPPEA